MNKIKEWGGVVALVAIILLLVLGGNENNVGGGTRYPSGLSADNTSPVAGEVRSTTLTTTATSTSGSQGSVSYYTKGGIDYADYQQTITATSSVICVAQNPFSGATSTLVSYLARVTSNGIAATQNLYVSTTTGTGGYGSSTPAIVSGFAAGTGQFNMLWQPNSATTTADVSTSQANAVKADLLPGMTNTGASNYTVGPTEYVTTRVATSTPRTLDTYYTGTCSATFMRP